MSDTTVTLVTNTWVAPDHDQEFAAWQTGMSEIVAAFPGFVSAEVIPPSPPYQVDWVIVQRFDSQANLQGWLSSPQRASMMQRIRHVLVGADSLNVFVGPSPQLGDQPVTAVIMTKVIPGAETAFGEWHKRAEQAQAQFPGYMGCELQPPVPGFQDHWATLLRFDSAEHLNDWLTSPERAALIAEAQRFTERSMIRRARNGFSNWFSFGKDREGLPPAWKNNYIVLLGLYPIVMLEILFLNPYLEWLPLPIANFIGNLISVGVLGWPVIWLLSMWMGWWLSPKKPRHRAIDWTGAILVLLLVAAMGVGFHLLSQAVQVTPVTSL